MATVKDLGNVKGEKGDKGDTYEPVLNNAEGNMVIDWKVDGVTKFTNTVYMPYYVPIKSNGQLKFVKNTTIEGTPEIASFDIENDLRGPAGVVNVEFKNSLEDVNNPKGDTLYIINDSESPNYKNVYAYDIDKEENNGWVLLDAPLKFDDYILKNEALQRFNSIENDIETRIGSIQQQQYAIQALLGNITAIEEEETENENDVVIQMISNTQMEALRSEMDNFKETTQDDIEGFKNDIRDEIDEDLKPYVRFTDDEDAPFEFIDTSEDTDD